MVSYLPVLAVLCFSNSAFAGLLDCDFDSEGLCFWKNAKTNLNTYQWQLKKGPTASSGTGPNADHTTGSGYYLFTESSSPATFRNKARLVSGNLAPVKATCLSFWYSMYGKHIGALRIFLKKGNNEEELIWSRSWNQGNEWLNSNVTITSSEQTFEVIFESERGSSYKSDFGLDDITFLPGKCEKTWFQKKCGVNMAGLGCFNDRYSHRVMGNLLVTYRENNHNKSAPLIDWNNYEKSLSSLLCTCAKIAKAKGNVLFGLQFYGECWSAGGEISYEKYGAADACINGKFKKGNCTGEYEGACIGRANTNYMYELL